MLGAFFGMVAKVFGGISKIISGFIGTLVKGIIGFFNTIIDALNKLPLVNISKITVPALAAGGIVTSPTLALIGEAGAEAVVPLDRMGEFGGGASYSTEINIGGILDSRTMNQLTTQLYLSERKARVFGGK